MLFLLEKIWLILALVVGLFATAFVLAVIIARLVGGIEISIDLPWDLSSTSHFLPDAKLDRAASCYCR